MKKIIIIILAVVVIGGAAFYFFVLSGGEKEAPVIKVEYPLEFFTTNVKDSARMAKITVTLVVNQEGLEESLDLMLHRIRDTVVFILRDCTEAQLGEVYQPELAERIVTALNERLEVEYITEVLFSDFVMA